MRRTRSQLFRLTVLLLLCWHSNESNGVPFEFHFEGTIEYIHDYVNLDESVYIGAPFTGGYIFDPTGATDQFPEIPTVGVYYFYSAGYMWARIGNYDFVTADLGMLIWNDRASGDVYGVSSISQFSAAGYQWQTMDVILQDATRTALSSDALFTSVPNLNAFPTFRGLVLDLPGDTTGIIGSLTSLTPEPGTLALLALGALAVGHPRRHSRK